MIQTRRRIIGRYPARSLPLYKVVAFASLRGEGLPRMYKREPLFVSGEKLTLARFPGRQNERSKRSSCNSIQKLDYLFPSLRLSDRMTGVALTPYRLTNSEVLHVVCMPHRHTSWLMSMSEIGSRWQSAHFLDWRFHVAGSRQRSGDEHNITWQRAQRKNHKAPPGKKNKPCDLLRFYCGPLDSPLDSPGSRGWSA